VGSCFSCYLTTGIYAYACSLIIGLFEKWK
jgi:hypothetical protein